MHEAPLSFLCSYSQGKNESGGRKGRRKRTGLSAHSYPSARGEDASCPYIGSCEFPLANGTPRAGTVKLSAPANKSAAGMSTGNQIS